MSELIQPRTLKGFRDFLPDQEAARQQAMATLAATFRTFGFVPIDTPVLEYAEILLRKSNGETEKQVFRFKDSGERDVALRFDLTVPFARFVAEHKDELYFPFKRYHMAKVWRGEKPQAGRYREFVQCDFDIVGSESISSDFEILLLMHSAFGALGVPGVTIRLNHRGVFNAFLVRLELGDKSEDTLRTIDKLGKIGAAETARLLTEITGSAAKSDEIVAFAAAESTFDATLDKMSRLAGASPEAVAGIERLKGLHAMIQALGMDGAFVLDPAITRGLDYYTGLVYETFLNDAPEMGSVCSGGRYDNLAGLYMKERLPGVGSSIGLDRLMAALDTLGVSGKGDKNALDVLVLCLDASLFTHYHQLAAALRAEGLSAEVFAEAKKPGQQYQVAEKKGTRFALLCTAEEAAKGIVTVKNLADRTVREGLTIAEAIGVIRA